MLGGRDVVTTWDASPSVWGGEMGWAGGEGHRSWAISPPLLFVELLRLDDPLELSLLNWCINPALSPPITDDTVSYSPPPMTCCCCCCCCC